MNTNPNSSPFSSPGIHLLIDPDKWSPMALRDLLTQVRPPIRSLVVGGSYVHSGRLAETVAVCASGVVPVATFVGAGPVDSFLDPRAQLAIVPILLGAKTTHYVTDHLFGIVEAAERLGVSLCCAGYLPLDGGVSTSCGFVTQYQPVPRGRPALIALMAKVAAALGLQALYLEAGSGATHPVTPEEVIAARTVFPRLLIVGGGLNDAGRCAELLAAGTDALFIGTHLEKTRGFEFIFDPRIKDQLCSKAVNS